jgi:hypothetical protein
VDPYGLAIIHLCVDWVSYFIISDGPENGQIANVCAAYGWFEFPDQPIWVNNPDHQGGNAGGNGNRKCPKTNGIFRWLPHGFGGLISGAVANGSVGSISFMDDAAKFSLATFLSGGAALTDGGSGNISWPTQSKTKPAVYGAFAGIGGGGLVTNAQSGNQIKGPFAQLNFNVGVEGKLSVSLAYDKDSGIWVFSFTEGPGHGFDFSKLTTTTGAFTSPGACG